MTRKAFWYGFAAAAALAWMIPAAMAQQPGDGKMDQPILMRPIGVVHSAYKEAKGTPIQGALADKSEAYAELKDEYVKGLKDLNGFSHAFLLYYFHKSGREEIVSKPYLEDVEHGIFAIRSPHRPNHIGLSIVKIQRIEGNRLYFTEVDILDGTPLLDIKPFVGPFDNRPNAVNGWIDKHFKDGKRPDRTKAD